MPCNKRTLAENPGNSAGTKTRESAKGKKGVKPEPPIRTAGKDVKQNNGKGSGAVIEPKDDVELSFRLSRMGITLSLMSDIMKPCPESSFI